MSSRFTEQKIIQGKFLFAKFKIPRQSVGADVPDGPQSRGLCRLWFGVRICLTFVGADGPVVVPEMEGSLIASLHFDHGHSLKSLHPPPAALPSLPPTARRLWLYQPSLLRTKSSYICRDRRPDGPLFWLLRPSLCGTKKRFRTIEPRLPRAVDRRFHQIAQKSSHQCRRFNKMFTNYLCFPSGFGNIKL